MAEPKDDIKIPISPAPGPVPPSPPILHLDPTQLPRLKVAEFPEILNWQDAVVESLRPFHQRPTFDAALLVSPDIIDTWALIQVVDVGTFPENLDAAVKALTSVFRPANDDDRLGYLRRQTLSLPAYRPGLNYTVLVARHCTAFKRLVDTLDVPAIPACKLFLASLRGTFGRLVSGELECHPTDKLSGYIAVALARARTIDAASTSGIADLLDKLPSRSEPRQQRPTVYPRGPPTARTTSLEPRGLAGTPPPWTIGKLTPEERDRCIREGLCLRCRCPGHISSACPRFGASTTPPSTSSPPQLPRPSNGNAPTHSTVAERTPAPYAPRRSVRIKIPRQPFTPSHAATVTPVDAPQPRPNPTPTPSQDHPVANIDIIHSADPTLLDASGRLVIDVLARTSSKEFTTIHCVLDTGAERSVINRSYADELKLTMTSSNPVTLQVADGSKEVCTMEVVVSIALTQEAPERQARIVVSNVSPPGPYVLLGLADLRGYSLTLGAVPVITWLGDAAAADLADPIDLPDPFDHPVLTIDEIPPCQLGDYLSEEERARVQTVLADFKDVFGPLDDHPAKLREFTIDLVHGTTPICQRPRFLPAVRREFVKSQIEKLLDIGVIRPSRSPWASPLVITTKRTGELRMCIDYRLLNAVTIHDAGPIPFQRDLFEFVAGNPYVASFDMTSGYYQIPVAPSTSPVLAFTTHLGLFEWTRLPFGPTNGPPHFQREISTWLAPFPRTRSFFDDIICVAPTFPEFLAALTTLFGACRMANIRINARKSVVGPRLLPYLGRLVGPNSIQIDPSRLEPLRQAVAPYDRPTLRSFLGLAQWFAPFVPHFSTLASPMWELLAIETPFNWSPKHQAAFIRVRDAITAADILDQPVQGRSLKLWSDASTKGIGGILLQQREDGHWGVLSFFSRKLTPAETRYCTIELEALAIVFCLDKGRSLIHGPLLIQTDHSNLQFLEASANRRVQRWSLFLHEFDVTIEYRPGRANEIADFLSRAFEHDADSIQPFPSVKINEIRSSSTPPEGEEAGAMAEVVRKLPHSIENGILTLAQRPPLDIIGHIFALAHDDVLSGHAGIAVTTSRIRSAVTWPGITSDIKRLCTQCAICQKIRALPPRPSTMASTRAQYPFESVFIDYLGPVRKSDEYQHILVMICRFSHWVELVATPDTTALTTATSFVDRWICAHGIPKLITTDGGTSFTGTIFHKTITLLKTKHHISAPLHPEGHGVVERANHSIMNILRALFQRHPTWHNIIAPITFAVNSAPSRVLGMRSPFEIVHGFPPRLVLNSTLAAQHDDPIRDDDPLAYAEALAIRTFQIYTEVRKVQAELHRKAQEAALASAKGQIDFNPGDFVLINYPRPDKISLEWRGPYQVVARESPTIYIVEELHTRTSQRVPATRLHRFVLGTQSPDELVAESARDGEFFVEAVHNHSFRNGKLWLFVKWLGFPEGDPTNENDDSWVRYSDSRFAPAVRNYVKQTKLHVRADGHRLRR